MLGVLITVVPACTGATKTAQLGPSYQAPAPATAPMRTASNVRCTPRRVSVCAMTVATN